MEKWSTGIEADMVIECIVTFQVCYSYLSSDALFCLFGFRFFYIPVNSYGHHHVKMVSSPKARFFLLVDLQTLLL